MAEEAVVETVVVRKSLSSRRVKTSTNGFDAMAAHAKSTYGVTMKAKKLQAQSRLAAKTPCGAYDGLQSIQQPEAQEK